MRPNGLALNLSRICGHPLIEVLGQVDLLTAPSLERAISQLLRENPRILMVDLRQTAYIDSTGLRCLILARRKLLACGGELILLVPPSGFVRRILEITGTISVFRVCSDPGEVSEANLSDGAEGSAKPR